MGYIPSQWHGMVKTGYRVKPRIWDLNYIALAKNRRVFAKFKSLIRNGNGSSRILDIGCGEKPFRVLFPDALYVGTDFTTAGADPDVLGDNNLLPIKDNSFDAVIASETLEHTPNYEHAISEMVRVVRNGGYIYISIPFMFPLHYHLFDFQRITEYRFKQLFKNHDLIELEPSNTIFSTWLMMLEYALAYALEVLPFSSVVKLPLVMLINVIVILVENVIPALIKFLINMPGVRQRILPRIKHPRGINGVLTSMPCGYAILVRVKK